MAAVAPPKTLAAGMQAPSAAPFGNEWSCQTHKSSLTSPVFKIPCLESLKHGNILGTLWAQVTPSMCGELARVAAEKGFPGSDCPVGSRVGGGVGSGGHHGDTCQLNDGANAPNVSGGASGFSTRSASLSSAGSGQTAAPVGGGPPLPIPTAGGTMQGNGSGGGGADLPAIQAAKQLMLPGADGGGGVGTAGPPSGSPAPLQRTASRRKPRNHERSAHS